MGITVVFLHAILSTFFSYPMDTTIIPLAFATIAMLTDLFELTFPEPPYRDFLAFYTFTVLRVKRQMIKSS